MSDPRRVVVTGLGVVSALGANVDEFWRKLCAGEHGFAPLTGIPSDALQFSKGAQALEFDPRQHFARKELDLLDRFAQLLLVAAREAIRDAGVPEGGLREAALVTATSLAGQTTQDDLFRSLYQEGRRRLTPFAVPKIMSNSGASQLSMESDIRGPTFTVSTACSSSNHAIGLGYWLVSRGMTDCAVVGGSDAPFSLGHLKAWDALRVVSPDVCRPFSKDRDGLTLGEGAGVLVLETLAAARRRAAKIRAEIVGFGMSADAAHITRPSREGALAAMTSALSDAELSPADIDYVNAHGTGTLLNDRVEVAALEELFPSDALPFVSSTKSMHGHALGAAGAIEAVATIRTLETQRVPPTANFTGLGESAGIDFVANESRAASITHAMSSSFAFGGLNASLVFSGFSP